jgi:3'(2'), 5'-bisphosphate nucleotidase
MMANAFSVEGWVMAGWQWDGQSPEKTVSLLAAVAAMARQAGEVVLRHYADPACAVCQKPDGTPLTAADEAADALLRAALLRLTPDIPVVTEECVGQLTDAQRAESFWLVDPLDGTREFIAHNGEFTINIALIVRTEPVLGVVHAPALGRLFAGAQGQGAWVDDGSGQRPIRCQPPASQGLRIVASRSHGDAHLLAGFLAGRPLLSLACAGSSLKFGLVAAGEADLYPRLGRTMEWDTAAGHAVLWAAGGQVRTLEGAVLAYGKPGFVNPGFVAQGWPGV